MAKVKGGNQELAVSEIFKGMGGWMII